MLINSIFWVLEPNYNCLLNGSVKPCDTINVCKKPRYHSKVNFVNRFTIIILREAVDVPKSAV